MLEAAYNTTTALQANVIVAAFAATVIVYSPALVRAACSFLEALGCHYHNFSTRFVKETFNYLSFFPKGF